MKSPTSSARLALLLAASLLAPASGHAAKWTTVRADAEKTAYLDRGGIVRRGDVVQAWELEKFAADQENKAWEGKYRSVKSLVTFDCARRTTEPVLRVYLSAEGSEVKRVQLQGLQFPSAVEPDSLREKTLELACEPPKDNAKDRVAAKPEDKPKPGLIPEAAAADLAKDKDAATPAKSAEAGNKAAGDKPANETKPADKAVEGPTKVALLTREAPQAAPAVRPAPVVAPRPAPRAQSAARVALRREQRAKPAPQAPPSKQAEVRWSYTGESGADNWGGLSPSFAACAQGRQQSPIDIRDGARLDLEPIEFSYAPGPLRIIDTGHTVQVNLDAGRYIVVMGRRYELKQFHFHKPAEERIDGRSYDMAAHLVHRDLDGRIAIIAVLFEAGGENAFIRRLWPYLPLERGPETYLPEVRLELDKLLPESRTYYTYMGSLTTPPCTEGVLWIVMKTPVPISAEQVAVFSRLYPMNARPVQASNGRFIKESM